MGWNIHIRINFYQSWSNVQIKFCDFNKFKNWLTVWNFQFIKTGHGFGRTKHFGVPQFGNFAWLVKSCSWLSWATIFGYLLHHFSDQRIILKFLISITMFRTASFQICDRDPPDLPWYRSVFSVPVDGYSIIHKMKKNPPLGVFSLGVFITGEHNKQWDSCQ